jgi:hypothetical protein
VVGGAADLRDAIGSAIHGDWVGSGFSVLGAVPGGDAIAVPAKAAKFIERNPRLAAAAASLIVRADALPAWIKARAARVIWPDWDELLSGGADERALMALQRGRTDLQQLAQELRRAGSVPGNVASSFARGKVGEAALAKALGAHSPGLDMQVRLSTAGCTTGCTSPVRVVDVLKNGVAYESKVGYVRLSAFTEEQIRKDAWLINQGAVRGAHWHFFASDYSNTLGADPRVLDLLDEAGIAYTIHLPAAS